MEAEHLLRPSIKSDSRPYVQVYDELAALVLGVFDLAAILARLAIGRTRDVWSAIFDLGQRMLAVRRSACASILSRPLWRKTSSREGMQKQEKPAI